jgi:alpha-L-rhamnosidase
VLHHVDLREAFGKWIQDHADAQDEHGGVPQNRADAGLGPSTRPGVERLHGAIPWNLYWEYGNPAVLEAHATSLFC